MLILELRIIEIDYYTFCYLHPPNGFQGVFKSFGPDSTVNFGSDSTVNFQERTVVQVQGQRERILIFVKSTCYSQVPLFIYTMIEAPMLRNFWLALEGRVAD